MSESPLTREPSPKALEQGVMYREDAYPLRSGIMRLLSQWARADSRFPPTTNTMTTFLGALGYPGLGVYRRKLILDGQPNADDRVYGFGQQLLVEHKDRFFGEDGNATKKTLEGLGMGLLGGAVLDQAEVLGKYLQEHTIVPLDDYTVPDLKALYSDLLIVHPDLPETLQHAAKLFAPTKKNAAQLVMEGAHLMLACYDSHFSVQEFKQQFIL